MVTASRVNCLEGNTFMVSDLTGDVQPDPDQAFGLFYRDVRHLSRWQLTVDGNRLDTLSHDASAYQSATFFLTGPGSNVYDNPALSVIRRRTLGVGSGEDLHEDLTVLNSGSDETVVRLSLTFEADFADLFEVKDKSLSKVGRVIRRVGDNEVELTYRREDFQRRTTVHAEGAQLSQGAADFLLRLAPAQSWSGTVRVSFDSATPQGNSGTKAPAQLPDLRGHRGGRREDLQAWLDDAPRLQTSWDGLRHTYHQSLRDLAAMILTRGFTVTQETVREWEARFAPLLTER